MPERVVSGDDLVSRVENLMKVRLDLERNIVAVGGRNQSRRNLNSAPAFALPSPDKVRKQQTIDEELRVIFIAKPRAGLQFPLVDQCQGSDGRLYSPYLLALALSHLKAGFDRDVMIEPW